MGLSTSFLYYYVVWRVLRGRVEFVLCFWGRVHFVFFLKLVDVCLKEELTFSDMKEETCKILLFWVFKEKLMETPFFLARLLV